MAPSTEAGPDRVAVERQLDKMLQNATFSSRPKQAELFAFIVKGTLNGEEMTEKYLREKLYPTPPYEQDSNIARRTIELVRGLLGEYYAGDGKEDLVIIALPKSPPGKRIKFASGEAYRPSFTYNSRHQAMQEYKLGSFYKNRGHIADFTPALKHYIKAMKIHPQYVDAALGMASVFCDAALFSTREERQNHLASADDISKTALNFAPFYWKSHFIRAVVLAQMGDIANARIERDTALSLDRKNTTDAMARISLASKLDETGSEIELARAYLEEHIDDPDAHALYAAALVGEERFEEALPAAETALSLDRNSVTALAMMVRCFIRARRLTEAEAHIDRLKLLVDGSTFATLNAVFQRAIKRES